MKYQCLPQTCYSFEEYSLVAMREEDILDIKEWRNKQIDVLRQKKELTDEDQRAYYYSVVKPSFEEKEPCLILFSYLWKNQSIGYGGLTNIDWEAKRAEISFLLNPERIQDTQLYQREFTVFLNLIKKIAFEDLGMNRLFTETYDLRPAHINILELNGFKREGCMQKHVMVQGCLVDSLIHGFLREWYHVEG